ncbi:O-antigen ligase family protein [Bacillus sp. B1-b2]|uniref:O-antigen ligase family protein n=1 Tax=Bacillus sp. B1-b2 TaxID=2653201 RepID=UPI001261D31E|nr:O-antigen ligase family protein [Bacillus sp. B1-b2]KAB7668456.1 hypothetical protein F9279_13645 [Bacillus sp. B1-b2]
MKNKDSSKKIIILEFILLALIFVGIPINGLPYKIGIFGEMAFEGPFYVLFFSIPLYLILSLVLRRKLYIPINYSYIFFVLFIVWVIVGGLVNLDDILSNTFKGRTGISKFAGQIIVIFFSIIILTFLYNLMKKNGIGKIKKVLSISLILPFIYSFLEILHGLKIQIVTDFLISIDKYIHAFGILNYLLSEDEFRIRSVSGEASWFATYLVLIIPWLIRNSFFTKKLIYKFLLAYSLVLTYLTFSRTVYIIILIQIIFFIYLILKNSQKYSLNMLINETINFMKKRKAITFILLLVLLLILILIGIKPFQIIVSLFDNNNLSNTARLSSQIAAIKMGLQNFITGIGLGQYGFYMPDFVSENAVERSTEIAQWASKEIGSPWPPVHGLYARIFAETGLIGLLLWLSIWGSLFVTGWNLLKRFNNSEFEKKYDLIFILTVLIGLLFIGFNIDTFRVTNYYVFIAMAFVFFEEYGETIPRRILSIGAKFKSFVKKEKV